jgi:hypothetical protein
VKGGKEGGIELVLEEVNNIKVHYMCNVLPNKDHAMCGKERFIGTRP